MAQFGTALKWLRLLVLSFLSSAASAAPAEDGDFINPPTMPHFKLSAAPKLPPMCRIDVRRAVFSTMGGRSGDKVLVLCDVVIMTGDMGISQSSPRFSSSAAVCRCAILATSISLLPRTDCRHACHCTLCPLQPPCPSCNCACYFGFCPTLYRPPTLPPDYNGQQTSCGIGCRFPFPAMRTTP